MNATPCAWLRTFTTATPVTATSIATGGAGGGLPASLLPPPQDASTIEIASAAIARRPVRRGALSMFEIEISSLATT